MDDTKRRHAPATLRNRDAILAALKRHLPARGAVLEVASGTGEHAAHFAAALPLLAFRPSDPDPGARASIDAWAADARLPNLRAALALDVSAAIGNGGRRGGRACCASTWVHIAPWAATAGLMRGRGAAAAGGGACCASTGRSGGGRHTAPSNAPSTRTSAPATRRGACATWKRWLPSCCAGLARRWSRILPGEQPVRRVRGVGQGPRGAPVVQPPSRARIREEPGRIRKRSPPARNSRTGAASRPGVETRPRGTTKRARNSSFFMVLGREIGGVLDGALASRRRSRLCRRPRCPRRDIGVLGPRAAA
jgi:hypothetical protein